MHPGDSLVQKQGRKTEGDDCQPSMAMEEAYLPDIGKLTVDDTDADGEESKSACLLPRPPSDQKTPQPCIKVAPLIGSKDDMEWSGTNQLQNLSELEEEKS